MVKSPLRLGKTTFAKIDLKASPMRALGDHRPPDGAFILAGATRIKKYFDRGRPCIRSSPYKTVAPHLREWRGDLNDPNRTSISNTAAIADVAMAAIRLLNDAAA
jgi:hypothetical protein